MHPEQPDPYVDLTIPQNFHGECAAVPRTARPIRGSDHSATSPMENAQLTTNCPIHTRIRRSASLRKRVRKREQPLVLGLAVGGINAKHNFNFHPCSIVGATNEKQFGPRYKTKRKRASITSSPCVQPPHQPSASSPLVHFAMP